MTREAIAGRDDSPGFEVVALSDHEWRVCDPTIGEGDPRRVLGFIARHADEYDVLALIPAPVACGCFENWDSALQALLPR